LNHNRIIAVGRLVYEKNHRDLLKAFFTLVGDFPQWRLDIFGNGPKYKELEDQIVAAGLSEKVGLKAPVENIEKELLSSSIFVCTSLFESFSLAIVEAMGCGLPVVSYNCPYGPREIIKDGENGFLVSHGNVNMLAEKLRVLMEDEFIRKKMGGRAREHVKKYSIDVVTKEWRDLFEELTHQPSVGPRQKE
jgi:glycosyltransferase involved in cell wall biosynthesis